MTKEETIKNAYGEHWESLKEFVDDDGWCKKRIEHEERMLKKDIIDVQIVGHGQYFYRPKSLQGIETNNGWKKIESEADLPSLKDELIIFRDESGLTTTWQSDDILETPKYFMRYSHYKIKEKDLPPIY